MDYNCGFTDEELEAARNTPSYHAMVRDMNLVVVRFLRGDAESEKPRSVVGEPVSEVVKPAGYEGRARIEAQHGARKDIQALDAPDESSSVEGDVQPIYVGDYGVVARQYAEFEYAWCEGTVHHDILSYAEREVVEQCVGMNYELSNDMTDNATGRTVISVTERSLENALGFPRSVTLEHVRPVGNQLVHVKRQDVETAFGPAAPYLYGVMGSSVSVGVFLAWYVRAVGRGYAGAIELVKGEESWFIKPCIERKAVECLHRVVAVVGSHYTSEDTMERLGCVNINPNVVLTPYQHLRVAYPQDHCDVLTRAPYRDVVCAVTGGHVREGVDAAIGRYVGNSLAQYMYEYPVAFPVDCWGCSSVSYQSVGLPSDCHNSYGECGEYILLLRDNAKLSVAAYVAWCVWLARRGVVVQAELVHRNGWYTYPRHFHTPLESAACALTAVAAVIFDEGRTNYSSDARGFRNQCGVVCESVGQSLVDYRFGIDHNEHVEVKLFSQYA